MLIVNFLCSSHLSRRKLYKVMLIILIDLHHTGFIATPVTVIGRRPYCNQGFITEVIHIPLLHKLMGTCDGLQVVYVQKLLRDLLRKEEPCAAVADGPALNVRVGVRPNEVAHVARLWNLTDPLDVVNLVDKWYFR